MNRQNMRTAPQQWFTHETTDDAVIHVQFCREFTTKTAKAGQNAIFAAPRNGQRGIGRAIAHKKPPVPDAFLPWLENQFTDIPAFTAYGQMAMPKPNQCTAQADGGHRIATGN